MGSVFITGHRGLLGATLVRVLGDAGWSIHTFSGDITDTVALQAFVSSLDALDFIVHTAAATDVNLCERESEWCARTNVDGTRLVCQAANSCGARIIYISTVSVFSGQSGNYYEEDIPDPQNQYNRTKLAGEQIVSAYDKGLVIRVNLIGIHPNGSRGKNFIEWLIDSIRQNKDLKLFIDVRINPLSNWTLAENICHLIEFWPHVRILHLGSRQLLSKAEIGHLVLRRFPKYTGKVEEATSDVLSATIAFRPKEMWLNVDYVQNKLGMRMPTLEEEIERIIQSMH